MRTTLTLDEDISPSEKSGASLPRFKVEAKACGFQRGVDISRLNKLNDELEFRWANPL